MFEQLKSTSTNDSIYTTESKTATSEYNFNTITSLNDINNINNINKCINTHIGICDASPCIGICDASPRIAINETTPYIDMKSNFNYYKTKTEKTETEKMNTENTNITNTIVTTTEFTVDVDPVTPQIDKALNNNLFDQINEQGIYFPDIIDIKYNDGTTIVTFDDKTKVVVKISKHDKFSYEQGLVYAIVKRLFGFYDNETGEFKTEGFSRLLNEIVNSGYDLKQKKTVDEIVNSEKYKKLKEKEEKEQEQLQKIRDNHFIKKIKRQARKDAKRNAEYSKFYDKYYKEYLEKQAVDKKETEKSKKTVREIIVE